MADSYSVSPFITASECCGIAAQSRLRGTCSIVASLSTGENGEPCMGSPAIVQKICKTPLTAGCAPSSLPATAASSVKASGDAVTSYVHVYVPSLLSSNCLSTAGPASATSNGSPPTSRALPKKSREVMITGGLAGSGRQQPLAVCGAAGSVRGRRRDKDGERRAVNVELVVQHDAQLVFARRAHLRRHRLRVRARSRARKTDTRISLSRRA